MSTVIDLRGRSFLKLADFTPDEIRYLLDLSAELKAAKKEGREEKKLVDRNIALIFEKDSTRTRCAFEVAALRSGRARHLHGPERLAHGPQGDREGHGARARPDVRRDRVPRLRPGGRRGARRELRRAGLQRPDRRVAPDADARRLPDLHASTRTSPSRRSRSATSATRASTWPTATSSPGPSWAWTSAIASPKSLWPREEVSTLAQSRRGRDGREGHDHRGRRRGRQGRRLPAHRRLGVDGRAGRRLEGANRPPAAVPGQLRDDGDDGQPEREVHALPAGLPQHGHPGRQGDLRQVRARGARGHRGGLRVGRRRSSSTRPRTGCTRSRP